MVAGGARDLEGCKSLKRLKPGKGYDKAGSTPPVEGFRGFRGLKRLKAGKRQARMP